MNFNLDFITVDGMMLVVEHTQISHLLLENYIKFGALRQTKRPFQCGIVVEM